MRRRKSTGSQQAENNPRNALGALYGNFTAGGSWEPEAERKPGRTKTYDAVLELVRIRRRFPETQPHEFVPMIRSKRVEDAFPMLGSWAGCRNWLEAGCCTAAERAVKTGVAQVVPSPTGEIPESTPEIDAIVSTCVGLGRR